MLDNRWFSSVLGVVSLVGSFFITLWLTDPKTSTDAGFDPVERLQRSQVNDSAALASAARTAGLVRSNTLRGHIDEIKRLTDGQVRLAGWTADNLGDGTPLTVLAFVAGRGTLLGKTDGSRDDVTKALNLSAAAARHVVIVGSVHCNPGETVLTVAINKGRAYAPIKVDFCP